MKFHEPTSTKNAPHGKLLTAMKSEREQDEKDGGRMRERISFAH